jgi:hypothetical protein
MTPLSWGKGDLYANELSKPKAKLAIIPDTTKYFGENF